MTDRAAVMDAINACKALFLAEIQELDFNGLRLVVAQGLPVGPPQSVEIAGVRIENCTRVEPTDNSDVYELIWQRYIGYSVVDESFAAAGEDEIFEGKRLRIYSRSNFLDYMSKATFASEVFPGPARHYRVACEDQIVDVLSVDPPHVSALRP